MFGWFDWAKGMVSEGLEFNKKAEEVKNHPHYHGQTGSAIGVGCTNEFIRQAKDRRKMPHYRRMAVADIKVGDIYAYQSEGSWLVSTVDEITLLLWRENCSNWLRPLVRVPRRKTASKSSNYLEITDDSGKTISLVGLGRW